MSIRITLFADMYIIHAIGENKKENVMKGVRPCHYCGGEMGMNEEDLIGKTIKKNRHWRIRC